MSTPQSAAEDSVKPGFDGVIRVRVPKDLRKALARLAHRRMKTESELAREVLFDYVQKKESEVAV